MTDMDRAIQALKETPEYKEFGYHIVICPVCGSITLDYNYICANCGWEYDGVTEDTKYSEVNQHTVADYRASKGNI